MESEDAPDAEVGALRVARDVHDHLPVNDYVSGPSGATSISLQSLSLPLFVSLCI